MFKKLTALALATVIALAQFAPTQALSLLQGEKHFYTVQLRSDAQAIVYAKIIFENLSDSEDLATYAFSMPEGVSADNLSVQQILAKKTGPAPCKTYETLQEWRSRMSNNQTTYLPSDTAFEGSKKCLVYDTSATTYDEDFDFETNSSSSTEYYDYTYYQARDSKYEYKDITPKQTDKGYSLTLPVTIKPKKQAAVLVSFSTKDYVKQSLGQYIYNVKSFVVDNTIEQATMAINFDEDVYSRDTVKQQRTTDSGSSKSNTLEGADLAAGASYENRSIDALQLGVGSGGRFVQTQSKMLPSDIMTVSGVYAAEKAFLFLNEIVLTLLLLTLASLMTYSWMKRDRARRIAARATEAEKGEGAEEVVEPKPLFRERPFGLIYFRHSLSISGVSVLATVVLIAITGSMYGSLGYSDSFVSFAFPMGMLLMVAFTGFVIPLLYAFRQGIQSAFSWSVVHTGIIVIFLVLLWILVSIYTSSSSGGPYYPYGCINC